MTALAREVVQYNPLGLAGLNLHNPYLDTVANALDFRRWQDGWGEWAYADEPDILEDRQAYSRWFAEGRPDRYELCGHYSWAIPTEQALLAIAGLDKPILEIGAGTGYWAYLLKQLGVRIRPYDRKPLRNHWCKGCWVPISRGTELAVRMPQRWKDYALMLCWPYMNDMAYNCLRWFEGNTVVYVGEHSGGCCAGDRFFELLGEGGCWGYEEDKPDIEPWGQQAQTVELPQWPGMHDYLSIWKKR